MSLLTEDLKAAIKDPRAAIQFLKEMRWRAKLYTHLKEVFIEQEYIWLQDRLKPDTTVLDLGAFIGDSAIYFAQNPKVKTVYALEALPGTYKEGKKFMAAARKEILSKIEYRNEAIGEHDGTMRLSSSLGSGSSRAANAAAGKEVKQVSLRTLLRHRKNVVVKCDVEGAEFGILDKVKKDDLKEVYAIIAEIHKNMGDPESITENMKNAGFKAELIRDGKATAVYGFYLQ